MRTDPLDPEAAHQPLASRTGLRVWLAAITLAAFGLRVWGIAQWGDLDFDEQASFFIGSMAPADMLRYLLGAPFEHPPLFYLAFHAWLSVVGGNETAMRLFAVIPGTLAVPLLGVGVARVSDARTGVVAAVVLALSPLHVYHSRDARMYTLLALLMTAMLAAVASGMARRAAIAAVAAIIALATHYYAAFGALGVAAGAWGLGAGGWGLVGRLSWISSLRRFGRSGRAGACPPPRGSTVRALGGRGQATPLPDAKAMSVGPIAHLWPLLALGLVTAGGALVWLSSASGFRTTLAAVRPRAVDPGDLLWALVSSLGAPLAGPLASPALAIVAAIVTVGLLGLGWKPPSLLRSIGVSAERTALPRRGDAISLLQRAAWGGFLCTTVGIPLLLFLGRPFAPRFVVLGTPFFAALLALGSSRLGTRGLVVAGVIYIGVAGFALAPMYAGYERSDYGAALSRLQTEVRPDDGVILNGPWQDLLYRRYGVGLPPGQIVASTVPLQEDETVGWLRAITSERPRVWVIDSATDAADPSGVVAAWLDANAYPRPVIAYQKALLRPYLTEQAGAGLIGRPVEATALGVRFTSVAMDRWTLSAGAESRLRIEGTRDGLDGHLRAVVDLVSPTGSSVWHWDGPLTPSGETLTYRAAVVVPGDASAGEYRLHLTAYQTNGQSGPRHEVVRIGEPVNVGEVAVAR